MKNVHPEDYIHDVHALFDDTPSETQKFTVEYFGLSICCNGLLEEKRINIPSIWFRN